MNKKVLICIVLAIVIALIIGVICYFKFSNSNNENKENKPFETNEMRVSENILDSEEQDEDKEEIDEEEKQQKTDEVASEDKIKEADKPNIKENDSKSSDVTINVGDYELRCGTYKGIAYEYGENGKIEESNELTMEIFEDNIIKMDNQTISFSIGTNRIICDTGASFQVIGNNELVYEVGGGVTFTFVE